MLAESQINNLKVNTKITDSNETGQLWTGQTNSKHSSRADRQVEPVVYGLHV